MFKKLIDNLGYVSKRTVKGFRDLTKEPFTEEELSFMLSELLQLYDDHATSEESVLLFGQLKNVEGLVDYLRVSANQDKNRYFGAITKEEQLIIRGAFARTNYLKAKIISGGEEKKAEMPGVRY